MSEGDSHSPTEANGPDTNEQHYDRKKKKPLIGDIAELGNHVYTMGTKHQADWYPRITDAIGQYVGKQYSKEMAQLVLHNKETGFTRPAHPSATSDTADLSSEDDLTQEGVITRERSGNSTTRPFTPSAAAATDLRTKILVQEYKTELARYH